jgi:Na+-translocating ferredoxin:NAD+ oxidoreductase subunit G
MTKQYAKLGFILAAFSLVACVGLSFVYAATKDRIANQASVQLKASLKELFPEADNFKDVTADVGASFKGATLAAAYLVERSGAPLGMAIKASGNSYGGPATLLVGVGIDRRIAGVRVLDSKDTPGLGYNAMNPSYFVDKATKKTFPGQFTGKALTDGFVVKKDVVAITAATISSKALTGIIKASGDAAQAYLERTSSVGGN